MLSTLNDKAMLAYLHIRCWSARKLDKKATLDITTKAAATTDSVRANKHLLASADASLRTIRGIGNAARRYLEMHSLPWDNAGNRIIANTNALEIIATIDKYKLDFDKAVEDFVVNYPALKAQAIINLGALADESDYPDVERIRSRFGITLSVQPLPENFSDVRAGLSSEQLNELRKQFDIQLRAQYNNALQEAYKRLRADLERVVERLSNDPGAERKVFRDSLLKNVQATCATLRDLNVFEDMNLERLRSEIESDIASISIGKLRTSDVLAAQTAQKATEILDRMKAFTQ